MARCMCFKTFISSLLYLPWPILADPNPGSDRERTVGPSRRRQSRRQKTVSTGSCDGSRVLRRLRTRPNVDGVRFHAPRESIACRYTQEVVVVWQERPATRSTGLLTEPLHALLHGRRVDGADAVRVPGGNSARAVCRKCQNVPSLGNVLWRRKRPQVTDSLDSLTLTAGRGQ